MWLIETNPGDILKIEVIFSSLGQSPVCDNTYFKVYDGMTFTYLLDFVFEAASVELGFVLQFLFENIIDKRLLENAKI